MTDVLVIGNGESRSDLSLSELSNQFTIVGCNAIHRELIVDHLICCDKRMVKESINNPNNNQTKIYTRPRYYHDHRKIAKHKNVYLLPELFYEGYQKQDLPLHWGSGPYAVLLAAVLGFDRIHMIGFDLYSKESKVNNIYKGTENYSKVDSQPVDPSFWIYQIKKVFKHFENKQFIIYNHSDWKMPKDWTCRNVSFENISSIKELTLNIESV